MKRRTRWLRALAWTVVGSVSGTYVFSNDARTSWLHLLRDSLGAFVYSGSCAVLCLLILPSLTPAVRRRFAFPFDWIVLLLSTIVIGTVGSIVATVIGVLLQVVPLERFWTVLYPGSLKVSIFFTVIFGMAGVSIQELRGRLNRTTLALRTKERDEAEARRMAAEAQLASLEARVDPHFLFNTLNSIAALVRDRPADAERVIEQLSSLMRSSLDRKQALVPLEEELALVRSYLEIERVRFGDRLRFAIDAAADAGAGRVPRLSLQTVVENSVKYAVSTSRDGASIRITAARDGDRLRLAVEDDGPGFDAAHLPEGHGLHLLRSRVAMTFAGRAGVGITSRPGSTAVSLDLPFEATS